MLNVKDLRSGYGNREILHGVEVSALIGEIVAIIGHNGAGKSTLLKAIFGLVPIWSGTVSVDGCEVARPTPRVMQRQGVIYLPQGNRVFGMLTVRENLEVAADALRRNGRSVRPVEEVIRHLGVLSERSAEPASSLSGGMKQALSLATLLLSNPRLVLLDEPSLGLAPRASAEALERISTLIRENECTAIIVEQKVRDVLRIADRAYVLQSGLVVYSGSARVLEDPETLRATYL